MQSLVHQFSIFYLNFLNLVLNLPNFLINNDSLFLSWPVVFKISDFTISGSILVFLKVN